MTTREELKDAFKRLDLVQEELFGLLPEASKNEVRLYATSTDAILEGLQK